MLEAEAPSKSLQRVSRGDPPGGVLHWIFPSVSSTAAAVASVLRPSASS